MSSSYQLYRCNRPKLVHARYETDQLHGWESFYPKYRHMRHRNKPIQLYCNYGINMIVYRKIYVYGNRQFSTIAEWALPVQLSCSQSKLRGNFSAHLDTKCSPAGIGKLYKFSVEVFKTCHHDRQYSHPHGRCYNPK